MKRFVRFIGLIALSFLCACPNPAGPSGGGGTIVGTTPPSAPFLGIEGIVTTFAGTAIVSGSSDSPCYAARFNQPSHVASDGTSLFIADLSNNTIRKIVISTGAVSTLAGTAGSGGNTDATGPAARFLNPAGIACDSTNVYVADTTNHTIRQIVISTGVVTTLAGTASISGTTDATGSSARFNQPEALCTDGTNLYVADTQNHTIRQVVISTRVVTTLAGTAGSLGSTDDTGSAARFYRPVGVVCVGSDLYVADSMNHTVRKVVTSTGAVTTLAGTALVTGSTDGTGSAACFRIPVGVASDGTSLYVTETQNLTVRKIVIATRAVTTLAGAALSGGFADGTGNAARFVDPRGVACIGANLYVTDMLASTVRKIVLSTSAVTTIAGSPYVTGGTDCTTPARFYASRGITSDGTHLYIVDKPNHTIRKVAIDSGYVKTLAGTAGSPGTTDASGSAARFASPEGITFDGTNLYLADTNNHTIRKIVISSGAVTTLAGSAGTLGSTDGTGTSALFNYPYGIANDGTNLYVTDCENHTIRKIVISSGAVTTIAGTVGTSGKTDGIGTAASFTYPRGLARDGDDLYVADTNNHSIRKIVISTGVVTTFAGSAGTPGSADGTGTAAQFSSPEYLASDGTYLYVADNSNNTIRKIVLSTGSVSTIAGVAGSSGTMDGTGSAARFYYPRGTVVAGSSLYVCDAGNHTIRMVR
jgi:hypothetical protein